MYDDTDRELNNLPEGSDSAESEPDLDQVQDSLDDIFEDWENEENLQVLDSMSAPSDQVQIDEAIGRLKGISEITSEQWKDLSEKEKIEALQQVETIMAEIQNRPVIEIKAEGMSPHTAGYYDSNDNSIHINLNNLGDNNVQDAVDTIVHEGRHAYQDYAVKHPGLHSDLDVVKAWKENFANYLDPSIYGLQIYMAQPVEKDAYTYADTICNAIYD
jgi:hypothetical protein